MTVYTSRFVDVWSEVKQILLQVVDRGVNNLHPLEVVSRYRHPHLQVGKITNIYLI